MSHVTNYVLLYGLPYGMDDEEGLARINAHIADVGPVQPQFFRLAESEQNGKALEACVAVAATNYALPADMIDTLKTFDWFEHTNDSVQLVYQDQHEDEFTMVEIHRTPDP